MRALKINTTINLETGETVNSGGIVVINEFTFDLTQKTQTTIPVSVRIDLYKGQAAYNNGKRPIREIQDFKSRMNLNFLISEYESTGNFELKIINLVKAQLDLIYPTFVETINL